MIERLQWDSENFKKEIGKFSASSFDDLQQFNQEDKSAFDLIYIFCPPGLSQKEASWFSANKLDLMDRKQVLEMSVLPEEKLEENSHIVSVDALSDSILDLTFQSGVYSRFKIDQRFSPDIFEMLYKTWITRSLSKEIARDVYGYFEGDQILGFITYGVKNGSGDIGLLAVDDKQRGKGIGKKLVSQVKYQTQKDGFQRLTVATQGLNESAIRFYKSCGFEVCEEVDIYHFWTS